MNKEEKSVQVTQNKQIVSPLERFTNEVMKQFSANNGKIEFTSFQNRLIQNYFIKLDSVLKEAERKRMLKAEKNRDVTAVTWENVNLQKLATEVVVFSRLGLDPTLPNHLNLIPYKNNSTSKYDITGIIGYRGLELKAKKYGLEIPSDVVVEVVYSNDVFKPIKKGNSSQIETYDFEIINPFERGSIVGGFYYHVFKDDKTKNKLRIFSLNDIEKRKPAYASAEFWGGEKDKYENGKIIGKEKVEGWFDEMVYKTIYRSAFNDVTLDAQKIDDVLSLILQIEDESKPATETKIEAEQIDLNIKINSSTIEEVSFEETKTGEPKQEVAKDLFEQKTPLF